MKNIHILAMLLLASFISSAQSPFLGKVSIEFEKTVAVWQLTKELNPEWFERSKERTPETTVTKFNFTGDTAQSIYKQTQAPQLPRGMYYTPFADNNNVYTDYNTGISTALKPVYEANYLVQDSLVKIKWKLTSDTRNIAGFECRKAIGILYDTVAVFAFYTDEILINGGPEGIQGLPGMILGVGIPRLHTTWFATSVRIADDNMMKAVKPVVKGKKLTRATMLKELNIALKDWDEYGKKMVLAILI